MVKEISHHLLAIAPENVGLVIYAKKNYYLLPLALQSEPIISPLSKKLGYFEASNWGTKLKYKLTTRPVLYWLLQYLRSHTVNCQELEKITLKKEDMLFLVDSNWMSPAKKRALLAEKQKGVKIIYLIYDLIPLKRPDFFNQAHVVTFRNHIENSLQLASGYITISASIAKELQVLLQQKKQEHLPVKYFYLGANKRVSNDKIRQKPRLPIQHFFSSTTPVFIIVSTIEPRKNHAFLLELFESLWVQGFTGKLCFIGRSGWLTTQLQKKILTHPEINHKLVWWQDINDQELAYIYQQATVLLSPSIEEGFGLPIVEALQNGLPVIASDIPPHQEISKGEAQLLPLDKRKAWEQAMLEFSKGRNKSYTWLSWQASIQLLEKKLKEF